jgi:CTP:molybdopterin cytidylyltransferase MocA
VTAAIILAAGESRRMGQPKALLAFRGGTFLSVLAETLKASCSPVYAVFGCDADELMKSAPQSVIAVKNPDYREGMLTSLQAGLRAMNGLPERILFTLVDHPAVEPETVLALACSDAPIAIARYAGKRGHPVAIDRSIASEILAEPMTSKLNDIMDRHAIRYLDVNDQGVVDDIDDPAMYRKLLAREGVRV